MLPAVAEATTTLHGRAIAAEAATVVSVSGLQSSQWPPTGGDLGMGGGGGDSRVSGSNKQDWSRI